MVYGALMWLACGLTYMVSLSDARTLREVGIWIKPMKFMAATAVFAWTTVWLTQLVNTAVTHGQAYKRISLLLLATSLFEVAYITYQASHGAASHYNTSDPWHAFMFGLMAVAAVGLTASQGWLAWELWKTRRESRLTVTSWGAIIGLMLTFVLSTVSGFMLGGNQPPAGPGLPVVGWHLHQDIRPSHFLGVHAQQLIPLWAISVDRLLRRYATQAVVAGSLVYVMLWGLLTWSSLSH
jgi:branched-subunit amino acid permease